MDGRRIMGLAICVGFTLPSVTKAQEVMTSLADVVDAQIVRSGDKIKVRDESGNIAAVEVMEASDSALRITDGRRYWTVTDGDVEEIILRDGWDDGAWLGAGVGIGVAMLTAFFSERDSEQRFYVMSALLLPSAASGAVVGGIADASMERTIYRRSSAGGVGLRPLVSSDYASVSLTVGW